MFGQRSCTNILYQVRSNNKYVLPIITNYYYDSHRLRYFAPSTHQFNGFLHTPSSLFCHKLPLRHFFILHKFADFASHCLGLCFVPHSISPTERILASTITNYSNIISQCNIIRQMNEWALNEEKIVWRNFCFHPQKCFIPIPLPADLNAGH